MTVTRPMLPHVLLFLSAAAMSCAWLPPRCRLGAAAAAMVALMAAGLWSGTFMPMAAVWAVALFAAAWWAKESRPGRVPAWILFAALALGAGFGLLPGFAPVVLTEPEAIKPDSLPYGLRFGPGKALAGVAMLLWLVPVAHGRDAWIDLVRRAAPAMLATAAAVPLLAWSLGYVRPAPGLPPLPVTLTWVAINLLLVCAVEEAFFRGLVQRGLTRIVPAPAAIALAAGLFGLAHFAGGWRLMLLAGVAGMGYGLAYERAGRRIEAAILAHFAVDLAHFALFTYPAWAGAPVGAGG